MALAYAHGAVQWLAADAAAAEYAVTGLGFTPKALKFTCVGIASATDAASQAVHWRASIGFATSPTARRCQGSQSQDAVGTQVCTGAYRDDAVVVTCTSSPAVDGLLDLKTLDADGFTLIVDDQAPVDVTVFWEAWGGADLFDARVGTLAEPAATGTQSYEIGFRPSIVLTGCAHHTANATPANAVGRTDAFLMLGAASGIAAAENICAFANDDDASTTSDTDRYAGSGVCLGAVTVGGGSTLVASAQLTAWADRGFTLNWITRAVTSRQYLYLAIQGGIWRAGTLTINANSGSATATVVAEKAGVTFAPVGLSFFGVSYSDAGGAGTTEGKIGVGCASSTSSRRAMGLWSENALGTASEIDTVVEYDACYAMPSNAGALAEAIDLDAILTNGFRLIVDTAGGVASEVLCYVACGSWQPETSFENYKAIRSGGDGGERIY